MTTLYSIIIYDDAGYVDDLPADDLHTVEGVRRRREAMEARRPKALGRDMLRLDRKAFLDEYRRRYGILPSAREWLAWLDYDKRRLEEVRNGSGVKAGGERRCSDTAARVAWGSIATPMSGTAALPPPYAPCSAMSVDGRHSKGATGHDRPDAARTCSSRT